MFITKGAYVRFSLFPVKLTWKCPDCGDELPLEVTPKTVGNRSVCPVCFDTGCDGIADGLELGMPSPRPTLP